MQLAAGGDEPVAEAPSAERGRADGIERSGFEDGAEPRTIRVERQDLDHAAERFRSVQISGRASDDLDSIDRGDRNAVPVDPAAERIIQRPAVGDDKRTARAGT
jgi:hypothetical protein